MNRQMARIMQSMAERIAMALPAVAGAVGRMLRAVVLYSPGIIGPALVVIALLMVAPWAGILSAGLILWAYDVVSLPADARGRHRRQTTRDYGDGRPRPIVRSDDDLA